MVIKWHISRDGASYGPYTSEQVFQFIREGRVSSQDWVWKEGMESWVYAEQVDDLASYFLPAGKQKAEEKQDPQEKKTLSPKKARSLYGYILLFCLLVTLGIFGFRVHAFFQGSDRLISDPVEMTVTPQGESITDTVRLGANRVRFDQVFAYDTSEDGYLDRRSYYQDDQLVMAAWDTNSDGSFDVWMRFVDGDYVDLKARDLTGDGKIDELFRVDENEVRTENMIMEESIQSLGFSALPVFLFLGLLLIDNIRRRRSR